MDNGARARVLDIPRRQAGSTHTVADQIVVLAATAKAKSKFKTLCPSFRNNSLFHNEVKR